MDIDDLLSPYRGGKPAEEAPPEKGDAPEPNPQPSTSQATPTERGPLLPTPDAWEMYELGEG